MSEYERMQVDWAINRYRFYLEDEDMHSEDALRQALFEVIRRVEDDMY